MSSVPRRRQRWLKKRWVFAGLFVALTFDFLAFRDTVAGPHAVPPETRADAIVVLTGGSGLRIAAGLDLLAESRGARMLISGANPDISPDEVVDRTGGNPALYDCCVDIGYQADSTLGNALETAAWAEDHAYDSLLVVTSDYHMPRALLHLRAKLTDIELIPVPVTTRIDPSRTFSDPASFRGTLVEWAKWRVTGLGHALT